MALISCLFCIGHAGEKYLEIRKEAFKRTVQSVYNELSDPLDTDAVKNFLPRRDHHVSRNKKVAHVVRDLVYDLHCTGIREISTVGLGFLVKMFKIQASSGPGLTVLKPSLGAFNFLLQDEHSEAGDKMLEAVCLAHASWAEKLTSIECMLLCSRFVEGGPALRPAL